MYLLDKNRSTLRMLLLFSVGITNVRSICNKQRSGSRYVVSNTGPNSCTWTDDFIVDDGYLNFTIVSDSICTNCSLIFQGYTVKEINPGSCIVVSPPLHCNPTKNDGCQHVIVPFYSSVITKVISQNEGERLNMNYKINECAIAERLTTSSYRKLVIGSKPVKIAIPSTPVTRVWKTNGARVESHATTNSIDGSTIAGRFHIPVHPMKATTKIMVFETTPPTAIKGLPTTIIIIIGAILGCLVPLAALVIVCIIRFRRSGQKRINRSFPNPPITPCTEEQEGRNHQNVESPYEVVAANTLQTSRSVCQTNGNPYVVQCDEGQYEIPRNSTSIPTTVESTIHRTSQHSKMMMQQQETSAAHIYESITQCSRNTERERVLTNSSYATMGPESSYAAATHVQDEYSRNFQDDYELMTLSPPVSSHNHNESRNPNSPCCSSASFRFDVSLPNRNNTYAPSCGNHSIKTENSKERFATNPFSVNLSTGSKRFNKEGHVGHCDSKLLRNRGESDYVNMTNRVSTEAIKIDLHENFM